MADYNDLIRAGLLNAGDRRDAGLMGLIALGQSIGNRGAARLSPTPPPLDLAGPMAVYQNSMNTALQRGALAKKMRDDERLRGMFAPRPVNEQTAQRMATGVVNPIMAQPAMDDPGAFGSDYDTWRQGYMNRALPLAREQTTVPTALAGVPAAARPLISAVGEVNPMAAVQMAGNLMAEQFKYRKQPSMVQEYEYARANGYDGSFQDFVKFKGSSAAPKNYGTIPLGYRMVTDGEGTPSRLEVIPGGPAEQAASAAKSAEGNSMVSRAQTARLVIDTADQILDVMNGTDQPVTGRISQPLGLISTLPAGRVRTLVAQLQSPIALGALTRLKESSKTGASGFGALNTAELTLLIDEIGRLDPDTTAPDIFQDNVKRIRSRYQSVIDNIKKEVTPDRIQALGLGPLLGISASSQGKTRKRWNQETQKFEEVRS